jgi:hypothetical protein
MSLKVLVPLAWTCWGILLGVVLVGTVWMARDVQPTPEVGPRFGRLVIAFLYVLVLGAGGLLYAFTKSQSPGGVLTMAVLLGFVVIMLIAQPIVMAYKQWSFEQGFARVGEFRDPALRPLAEAIRTGDCATLRQLLGGKSPPPGRDRAGHDLLGYALVAFRDRGGSLDCVRALLEAGSDPETTRMPDGRAPIHYMIVDITPGGREALLLLLNHGADPNAIDPITGDTPIRESGDSPELVRALVEAGADMDRIQSNGVTALVDFVAGRHWESARHLVERGARMDVVNGDGLSLDYYLEDWKDSVFGEHPEGWDRLRAAIAARGEGRPWPAR